MHSIINIELNKYTVSKNKCNFKILTIKTYYITHCTLGKIYNCSIDVDKLKKCIRNIFKNQYTICTY